MIQLSEKGLDEPFFLRQLLRKDMVPSTTVTGCVLVELLVARKDHELNVAITTMIDEVLEVDPDLAECLT